jgi:hypothetical protein
MRQRGMRAEVRSVQCDPDDLAPLFVIELRELRFATHAGVVDENVDSTEVFDRRCDQRGGSLRLTDVPHVQRRASAGVVNVGDDGLCLRVRSSRVDRHGGARRGQFERNRATDVTRAAGHDRDTAAEIVTCGHDRNSARASSCGAVKSVRDSSRKRVACADVHPPCRALSMNLPSTSVSLRGACDPPRMCG